MKTMQIMAVVALINVGALALDVASAQQPGTRRTELDPGVAFGKHRHPGEEIIYFALHLAHHRPRVGRGREPGPLDPNSCYACWLVMPTLTDEEIRKSLYLLLPILT